MPTEVTLLTLLHILIFVYWLGGDLGVFVSSFYLADEKLSPERRLMAAKILNELDLVPRLCLLLTLPSGLSLGIAKGWFQLSWGWAGVATIIAFAWIWLVLQIHHRQGPPGALWRQTDTLLRWLFFGALASAGVAGLLGYLAFPRFLALKLLALAFTVLMGLIVRRLLIPFGPALASLATSGSSPETNMKIAQSIGGVRPFVLGIWAALIFAAWAGVATLT